MNLQYYAGTFLFLGLLGCKETSANDPATLTAAEEERVEFYYTPTVDRAELQSLIISSRDQDEISLNDRVRRFVAVLHAANTCVEAAGADLDDSDLIAATADAILSGMYAPHLERLIAAARHRPDLVAIIDRTSTRLIEGGGRSETVMWIVAAEFGLMIDTSQNQSE